MEKVKMCFKRRKFFKTKPCTILFFGLLLIFIWATHSNRDNDDSNGGESFPDVLQTPVLSQSDRLYQLAKLQHLQNREYQMQKVREKAKKLTVTPRDYDATTDFDASFLDYRRSKMTAKPADRYFVFSQKCKMPYADPFSNEALSVFTPAKLRTCTNESDLFTLSFDRNLQQYKIHVNPLAIADLASDVSKLSCSYQEVIRGQNATGEFFSVILPPVDVTQNMTLDKNISGIIAQCLDERDETRIIQRDAFPLVQVINQTSRSESHSLHRQPSVIMLGLDTMSRMNFKRTMPRTAQYVQNLGWFELEGYNKVSDNTFPNLCVVLAGGTPKELEKVCEVTLHGRMDSCPWIWRDFKEAGYSTAYGEDILWNGVFVGPNAGFGKVPTDFYLRPLLMGLTESMRIYRRFGYAYCLGRRITVSYLYDFCVQFAQRIIEELDQPAFGFFWSCTFTHDYHHGASSLDGVFIDYLKILEKHQVFEKSIVILLSDHGERFGELVELPDGFLEERLPMLHIYLPPWFRNTYPKYAESLLLNRNRLSSNYDLHNTLRHILHLNASKPEDLPLLTNCPSSQSLLHPLPQERSCKDACIGDHFCSCNEFMAAKMNGETYNIVKLTVFYINRWLVLNHYNKKCDRLRLDDLDNAERKVLNEDNGQDSFYGKITIYRLRFHTNPPAGRFEATVRFHRERHRLIDFDIEDVSRLNRYHNDSLCIQDKIAKKFCFCTKTVDPEWSFL